LLEILRFQAGDSPLLWKWTHLWWVAGACNIKITRSTSLKREKESFCCFVSRCVPQWAWRKESNPGNCLRRSDTRLWPSMDNLKATSPSPETLIFLCPPYTMLSGSLRPVALQPTSLDVATRENLIEDCSEELFEWWRKHLNQLPNRLKLTFRHKGRQFHLTPCVTNLMKGGSMVGDPGGPHCWERERHKKAWLEFAKTHLDKPKSFWENVLWEDETKLELFGKAHHLDVYRKQNEAFKEKSRLRILKAAFWALFFFWFSSMISPTLWKILFISLLITPPSAYHLSSLRPASSSFFTLCRSG